MGWDPPRPLPQLLDDARQIARRKCWCKGADGEAAIAEHGRLRGRKGQYSTVAEHMPPAHAAMDSPWSPERFPSWARRIGEETGAAVDRLLASRPVVEQAFVPARNILGLSKSYSP